MAIEYASSPVEQAGTQMRMCARSPCSPAAREDLRLQRLERLRVAEEAGDADEHVLVQRRSSSGVALHELDVVGQLLDLVQRHPALDAPVDRGRLVVAEVVAERGADEDDELADAAPASAARGGFGAREVRVLADALQLLRDASGGRQKSAQPLSIALRGMPSYFAVAGSCANVMPPASLIALRPKVPSVPVPDSTMPIARGP